MATIRQISRAKLFQVFKTQEMVEFFESLFTTVNDFTPGSAATVQANLDAHIADATGAHQASAIGCTPVGGITQADVQGALSELSSWANKATPTGAVVGTSDAQILTNKQIDSPTGTMTLASGVLGYAAGNGGVVTQVGSKAAGVTLDKIAGQITMDPAALAAGTIVSFVLTNSTAAATDLVVRNHVAGGTLGAYGIEAVAGAGVITFYVRNNTAGPLAEALVLRYAVIKSANT